MKPLVKVQDAISLFKMMLNQALCFCLLGTLLSACSTQTPTIGFVNSTRLMQEYHGTATQRKAIARIAGVWQRGLDSMTTVVSESRPVSDKQQLRLTNYRTELQQKNQAASQQSDHILIGEVNAYLNGYGQTKGCDFILGANDSGNIVYASESTDLTTEVLVGLNRKYDQQHAIIK